MALVRVPVEHNVGRSEWPVISQRSSGTPDALMRIDFHETFRWNVNKFSIHHSTHEMSRWDMKDTSQMLNSEQNVQECDATGMIVALQPGHKQFLSYLQ